MKKQVMFILVSFFVALFAATVSAAADVVFHNANQSLLGWNAVTTDVDGDPCVCIYEVLIANKATDPEKTNPTVIPVETVQYLITLGVKGRYYVGVRAVIDDEEGDLKSGINWADDPDYQTVAPFGIKYLALPNVPLDIHGP